MLAGHASTLHVGLGLSGWRGRGGLLLPVRGGHRGLGRFGWQRLRVLARRELAQNGEPEKLGDHHRGEGEDRERPKRLP